MTQPSRADVLRRRLAQQRLTGPGLVRAADVVRLLACVQSQEHAHACWSLGMRTTGLDYDAVRAEFDAGAFVRTHILRPTWHFVAPEDLRWIQAVTAPRVHQLNSTIRRQYDLDLHALDRSTATILAELAGGRHRTRKELGTVLASSGVKLAYQVMHAELEGLLCSGPMRGAQHTYALVDERIGHSADGNVAELARRFFVGHGPASIADFARWSSLTKAQCAAAVEEVGSGLERMEIDGTTLWSEPSATSSPVVAPALLLPLYDEATLSYPQLNFPAARGHPHPPGEDLFVGSVVVDQVNVGTWRRTVKGRTLVLELALAPGVDAARWSAIRDAARRLAGFLELDLELVDRCRG
jgi:hypothetical protein